MKTVDEVADDIIKTVGTLSPTTNQSNIEALVKIIICDHLRKDRATMVSYIEYLRDELGEEHPEGIRKRAV